MITHTKTLALVIAVTLSGAPIARATGLPKWMSYLDFMRGNWTQDGMANSTLTVVTKTNPALLTLRRGTVNSGAMGGHVVDATSELNIFEKDGELQADEQTDDIPHPPIHSHYDTVSIIPNKSVILTQSASKAAGVAVEVSYWTCEWNPKKLCLSYAVKRPNFLPSTFAIAVFIRH